MEELLVDLVPKLGIPSVIISIILLIIRIRPITLLTANPVERKMLSKEKQFSIKAIKLVFEIIFTVLFLFIITDSFFKNKNIYNGYFALVWALILLVGLILIMFFLEIRNRNFDDLFNSLSRKIKVVLFFLFMFFIISYYLLPTYFVGTQFYSDYYNDELNLSSSEKIIIIIATLILLFILAVSTLIPVSRVFYRFMGFDRRNLNRFNNMPIFIELNGERWFLQHPVEGNLYYITDSENIFSSTRFKFIARDELLTQTFQIQSAECNTR
jgi:hypothetical protein